ncbi:MAG: cyclic nucleotide-binding domain-containing protein [Verrucomicrobia bacterium]|nr:cyclic nucleotide-binding domain-containing protein [Verrucomicrobiota bacterium]
MNMHELFQRNDSIVTYKAGQTIFKEGEQGDLMYVLLEGVVDVRVGDKVVGTFEPIEIFGEMTVIDPGLRSATVVAKANCKFGVVNQKRFMVFVQSRPDFALHIMRMLVERVRWMDEAARTNKTTGAETVTKLEEQIRGLMATIQSQEDQIRELQEQLENLRQSEPAAAVTA